MYNVKDDVIKKLKDYDKGIRIKKERVNLTIDKYVLENAINEITKTGFKDYKV